MNQFAGLLKRALLVINFVSAFWLIQPLLPESVRTELHAQILQPAHWSTTTSKSSVAVGDELDLIFNVLIDKDWYLYSSDFDPDLGPIVTEFTFKPNSTFELVGEIKPVNPKKKYDELWEGEYTYFVGKAQFRQTVKVLTKDFHVTGSYNYQVCSEIDGKCILFEDDFSFDKVEVTGEGNQAAGKEIEEVKKEPEVEVNKDQTREPIKKPVIPFDTAKIKKLTPANIESEGATPVTSPAPEKSLLKQRETTDPYSLLTFMIIAFLGGLAALLTPCVFPMIPLTVTFFTGRAKNRLKALKNALFYGLSIIVIYSLVGSVIAPFMGPDVANFLATHWLPNILFFLIFIVFALSFFGLFEITLPSSFINKMDRRADKGGLIGIFFMAFTLVLVSFSCTGPIVGSILVESAGGMIVKPVLGMLGFSLAFAIPFTIFAIFPDWLSNLPKSGGWLNTVKVLLGFLELAFAFKFLSIADQAYHWHILDREVYLALWIVIFSLMGFYILGKIRLPDDPKLETIGVLRLIFAIAIFSFVLYLIPGMFGAPLKALAGYLPPITTQDFNIPGEIRNGSLNSELEESDELCGPPKYDEFLELPLGIKGYFDYDQAIQCAGQKNKPLFVDFTGHGCVNCREMEARVWSDPEVLKRLKNNFIVVSLYVDDKSSLPENEWYVSEYDGKLKKTLGKQNADFQITRFNNNAQPFYVILDNEGNLLTQPIAYDLNIDDYINFLDDGVKKFKEQNK